MYQRIPSNRKDPDHLWINEIPGYFRLFQILLAAPFLLVGFLITVRPVLGMSNYSMLLFTIPIGLIFTAGAGGTFFLWIGLEIDLEARKVSRWGGWRIPLFKSEVLLGPVFKKSASLDDLTAVSITREIRARGRHNTYTVYRVRFIGGEEPLSVIESVSFDKARGRAEQLAKFIGIRIEDSSSGETIIRDVDESLRDRLYREGRLPQRPVQPSGSSITMSATGNKAIFDIPARGIGAGDVIWMIILGGFLAFAGFGTFVMASVKLDGDADLILRSIFALLLFGIPLTGLTSLFSNALAKDRLFVSPRELRHERTSYFGTRKAVIATEDLEELSIVRRKIKVVVRSDHISVKFGEGLDAEDLQWLHDVILFIATA